MSQKTSTRSIEIRPDSGVYATYRRMSYKPWSAIAEFVDNSTQNFFEHKPELGAAGQRPALTIDLVYDPSPRTLIIVDNANGMEWEELERAIQLNRPPLDTSGRSEFGMGLKMAACWFGNKWRIVTKRLGSEVEYEALVDVQHLADEKPEAISVLERFGQDPMDHYTRVEIEDLHRTFRGRSLSSIKEHISSMYRRDIDSGEISIRWNGEPFAWEADPVFTESMPDGEVVTWRKQVDFEVQGLGVTGWVWIRIPGSARRAGLHLFRRDRLVFGGPGEGYKPQEIFQAPNSFQSQRLVGELDLDDWPVTQTKDAFDWAGELENELIEKLQVDLDDYVAKTHSIVSDEAGNPTSADGEVVGDTTKDSLHGSDVDEAVVIVETGPPPEVVSLDEENARVEELVRQAGEPTLVLVGSEGIPALRVYWLDDLSPTELYADFSLPSPEELRLIVNLKHPFVTRVIGRDPIKLELYSKLLYADALVERGIRRRGENVPAQTFRAYKDLFLRRVDSGQ